METIISTVPERASAFASAAVAENLAVVFVDSPDLSASNNGTSQTRSKELPVLVNGIALDGRPDELIDKLLLQAFDDHALSTESESLLYLSEVLGLTDIGGKSADGVALEN